MSKTSECTGKALFNSLPFCAGTTVLPGVRQRIYFIHYSDIVSWPKLPDTTSTSMGELATYSGNFTLASDKKWQFIDLTHNKGELECTAQGDIPSRTFLNKFTIKHPNFDAAAAGLARQIINDSIVLLIQMRNGKWRVIGSEAFRTECSPGGKSGEGMSGEFGTNIEIQCADVCPAPFYTGTIVTDAGTIDASTGTLT